MKNKCIIFICLTIFIAFINVECIFAKEIEVSSPAAILIEINSGAVIYEKDADLKRAPASVTKIMTMLLIFEALDMGSIKKDDVVIVSEHAASMGGSQVFLEQGEKQTVDTMIKCIAVSSANDACVAMAEHICGTENAFVDRMNDKAKELKMKNTHFENCNGLDAEGHLTTARDIAIMTRTLMKQYPEVKNYSQIWMDEIQHVTSKGTSEFGLSNTNKLIKQYPYATGLKTGSTSDAKFCVSATAKKDDIELIAVIMGADSSQIRFQEAENLLNYGFSQCIKYSDDMPLPSLDIKVKGGTINHLKVEPEKKFVYIDVSGRTKTELKRKIQIPTEITAPIEKKQKVGTIIYTLDDRLVGEVSVVAVSDVPRINMAKAWSKIIKSFLL